MASHANMVILEKDDATGELQLPLSLQSHLFKQRIACVNFTAFDAWSCDISVWLAVLTPKEKMEKSLQVIICSRARSPP
jgi:hypothetical protein